MTTTTSTTSTQISSFPWEILILIAQYLDPLSLATASCVSKSWSTAFSSDHLWSPLCTSHFPSLSAVISTINLPSRHIYSLGYSAKRHRHRRPKQKPSLALDHLVFTLSLATHKALIMTLVEPCSGSRMRRDPHDLFKFDVDVSGVGGREWTVEEVKDLRVTWHVGEKEWKAVFVMADNACGKGGFVSGYDGWFSEELPSPGCCSSSMSSGLVADLRLGLEAVGDGVGGDLYRCSAWGSSSTNKVRIEKVSLGILSIFNWRYVSLDDGLAYLQNFLPLSN